MKKTNCIECNKETTSFVYILTGKGWKYEPYCIMCARAYFGKVSRKSLAKLNLTQLNKCSYEYDILLQKNLPVMQSHGIILDDICIAMKKNINERSLIRNNDNINKQEAKEI